MGVLQKQIRAMLFIIKWVVSLLMITMPPFWFYVQRIPFTVFSDHHFSAHQRQMVVTESVVHERTLKEIDGLPAL